MSDADMKAELDRLRRENEELKQSRKAGGALNLKVSQKGAVSLYGMGRFPVTLYKEQWLRVVEFSEEIKKFIADNQSSLKSKGDKED